MFTARFVQRLFDYCFDPTGDAPRSLFEHFSNCR